MAKVNSEPLLTENDDRFVMFPIQDKEIWDNYIKTGLVKGFSVEGIFQNVVDQYTK